MEKRKKRKLVEVFGSFEGDLMIFYAANFQKRTGKKK